MGPLIRRVGGSLCQFFNYLPLEGLLCQTTGEEDSLNSDTTWWDEVDRKGGFPLLRNRKGREGGTGRWGRIGLRPGHKVSEWVNEWINNQSVPDPYRLFICQIVESIPNNLLHLRSILWVPDTSLFSCESHMCLCVCALHTAQKTGKGSDTLDPGSGMVVSCPKWILWRSSKHSSLLRPQT